MKRFLSPFVSPADPVVAVYESPNAAESAVRVLSTAGYQAAMLTIVGRRCPTRPSSASGGTTRRPAWHCSGVFWGVSVAALMTATALVLPVSALAPTSLLLVAALALALQTWIAATAVAPERSTSANWSPSSAACRGYDEALAADKLLLLVDGSRSEIALARSLLQEQ